jgi:DNA-binding transcriptional ArsR family regulator
MSAPLLSYAFRRLPPSIWDTYRKSPTSRTEKARQFKTLAFIREYILCNQMVTRFDNLDGPVFDALGDPTRRAILDLLRENERAAGDIASHFPASRPAIAKHVRILKRAGLVAERSEGRHRYYALNSRPLVAVDQWLQPYRIFWAARLVALKQLVESEENKNGSE